MATQANQDIAKSGMLERGLSVLECIAFAEPDAATASFIAKETGLPKSTVYRLAAIERNAGWIEFNEFTKAYSLSGKAFELAAAFVSKRGLTDLAKPIMDRLARESNETVQLSIHRGDSAFFIGRSSSQRAISIHGTIGQALPLYATSTGKCMLAALSDEELDEYLDRIELEHISKNTAASKETLKEQIEEVRKRGCAITNSEYDDDVVAIGAPIKKRDGTTIAALCISAPAYRVKKKTLLSWEADLKEAARTIGLMVMD